MPRFSASVFPPALAADGPPGIGFVQAEEGTWWCRDPDAAKAFACAEKQCAAGAAGQDCHRTRWCMPAGWAGLMIVWLPEFHSTQVVCGLPSQASVGAALKAICDSAEEYTRCDFIRVIDPDGADHDVSDMSWPGPAISPPVDAEPEEEEAAPG